MNYGRFSTFSAKATRLRHSHRPPSTQHRDLQDIVRELRAKGVTLKATEQPIDTGTPAGKAFLDMLGVFAEFETNLRRERQMEGIAAVKARGVYKGRPASIEAKEVAKLKAEGLGATEIARRLRSGRASVYRVLGETAE
jgi:DNA invertase Pin-like site-specific DNA recombinase